MARFQASLQVAAGAALDPGQLQMDTDALQGEVTAMQHLLHACASTNKLLPTSADSTGDYDAGEEICDRAETLGVRAVVLLHHGKGMMQEMLFGEHCQCGAIACSRHCCSACVGASCTLESDSTLYQQCLLLSSLTLCL